jgi:hypothetical protein
MHAPLGSAPLALLRCGEGRLQGHC